MAGGRRIDDHDSWVGKAPAGEVFPDGAKVKVKPSAEGAGELDQYWNTSDMIKEQQDMGIKKAKENRMKPGYRN